MEISPIIQNFSIIIDCISPSACEKYISIFSTYEKYTCYLVFFWNCK